MIIVVSWPVTPGVAGRGAPPAGWGRAGLTRGSGDLTRCTAGRPRVARRRALAYSSLVQNAVAYPIESVDNALRLLLILRERKALRVAEAAEELGVARSTAHRLLTTLRARGFVAQDGRRTYRPGPVFFEMGLTAVQDLDLRRVAHTHLAALVRELGETVHLVTLEGNGVRFIDGTEGHQVLRLGTRIGMLLPAHCTSGGKVLLAELSTDEVHALYPRGLPTVSEVAVSTLDGLLRELALTRQRGYGTNFDESERGVSAIGVCVRDQLGRAVAAVTTAVPTVRFPPDRAPEFAEALHRTAERITGDM